MTFWPKKYAPGDAPKEVLDLAGRLMVLSLAGDHPFCVTLRQQYERAHVREVELTGVGFFVTFEVPASVPRTSPAKFSGGDARIKVEVIPNGAGCVLFVIDGVVRQLEVYTYGTEEFPEHPVVLGIENAYPVSSYLPDQS